MRHDGAGDGRALDGIGRALRGTLQCAHLVLDFLPGALLSVARVARGAVHARDLALGKFGGHVPLQRCEIRREKCGEPFALLR